MVTLEITLTIIFGIIVLIISVFSIYYAYRIAKKSGSFKQADLDITIMNKSLLKFNQFREIIYANPKHKKGEIICLLPFKVKNNGDRSAKNVNLRLAFPRGLREGRYLDLEHLAGKLQEWKKESANPRRNQVQVVKKLV